MKSLAILSIQGKLPHVNMLQAWGPTFWKRTFYEQRWREKVFKSKHF